MAPSALWASARAPDRPGIPDSRWTAYTRAPFAALVRWSAKVEKMPISTLPEYAAPAAYTAAPAGETRRARTPSSSAAVFHPSAPLAGAKRASETPEKGGRKVNSVASGSGPMAAYSAPPSGERASALIST